MSGSDPLTAGLNLGDAIVMLIKGVIPTTPEQVACMQQYFPVITQRRLLRAQRLKEAELDQAKQYVLKHKVDPALFVKYINGDATMAQLVTEDVVTPPTKL